MWVIRLKGTDTYYSGSTPFSYGTLSEAVRLSATEKVATPLNDLEMWEEIPDVGDAI